MSALKGKTIVITGGSRGIGQAIALRYAAAEANVVILSKDLPANILENVQIIFLQMKFSLKKLVWWIFLIMRWI